MTEISEILWALLFRGGKKELPAVFLVNIMTNPPYVLTVLFCRIYTGLDRLLYVQIILEALIILIEYLIYRKSLKTTTHPFLLSLTANLFSILCGLAVSRFFSSHPFIQ